MRSLRTLAAIVVVPLLAAAGTLAAQQRDTTPPPGLTGARLALGDSLYHGAGNCSPCHGERGEGSSDGPSLVSGQWKRGPGTYDWLVHMVQHAGPGGRLPGDDPRPMRGSTTLDSAQVRAVAAYVWSISRHVRPGPPDPSAPGQ